ncbi:hypothetical protein OESDEN_16483 [Oesophagostomum dentatum]|uniref:Uncharacterized protein n=1 Tax=Oesophagostomum dentatum TaxID=61180 RepID=A0A0B1SER7_OESDE|nr:hypothetical protein OESDEN_16483 [Oesophagostomum dentatum]
MSSAGVMITLSTQNKEETRGIVAASSTGAERTVQGTANAILRMIFQKSAGEAVKTERVYLDLSDGLVHCTPGGNKAFENYYGFRCDSLDHREPDRRVMAMLMDDEYFRFALFAVTPKEGEYNYGVGQ